MSTQTTVKQRCANGSGKNNWAPESSIATVCKIVSKRALLTNLAPKAASCTSLSIHGQSSKKAAEWLLNDGSLRPWRGPPASRKALNSIRNVATRFGTSAMSGAGGRRGNGEQAFLRTGEGGPAETHPTGFGVPPPRGSDKPEKKW